MANYCSILNKFKKTDDEVVKLIEDILLEDLKINSFIIEKKNVSSRESYIEVKVKDQVIPVFYEFDNIVLFDTPGQAYRKTNEKPYYLKDSLNNPWNFPYSGYGYIHEYLKNRLAEKMDISIESEAIGLYLPFSGEWGKERSFKDRRDIYQKITKTRPWIVRFLLGVKEKHVLEEEKQKFPEFF